MQVEAEIHSFMFYRKNKMICVFLFHSQCIKPRLVFLDFSTVVPQHSQGIGSRTHHGYHDPSMPKSHSGPSVSMRAEPADSEPVYVESQLYIYWKKSAYKWTCAVWISVIQGSTELCTFMSKSVLNIHIYNI